MSESLFDDLFGGEERAAETAEAPDWPKPPKGGAVIWDIETGPEPDDVLESLFEFDPATAKDFALIGAEFDPTAVKTGTMKDPAKIAAKINAARESHERAVANAVAGVEKAREDAWTTFRERAPLSALTGRVLAIGYQWDGADGPVTRLTGFVDREPPECMLQAGVLESYVLEMFWAQVQTAIAEDVRLVGHNVYQFDLPFLVRRSWRLGVSIPAGVFTFSGGRWQWARCFIDTMTAWSCGIYGERVKLDRLGQFFGTARKLDGVSGGDFHKLFHGTRKERDRAAEYLTADLAATTEVARKMGVI